MTQKELCIGIVRASVNGNRAEVSHVPAINRLRGLKLAAVATRKQSARETAEAFGADRWFSYLFTMIGDDRIDVVTISVKVPAHRELFLAALSAGKAVHCEAPLARTAAQAADTASAAGSLHTATRITGIFESSRAPCSADVLVVLPSSQERTRSRRQSCNALRYVMGKKYESKRHIEVVTQVEVSAAIRYLDPDLRSTNTPEYEPGVAICIALVLIELTCMVFVWLYL